MKKFNKKSLVLLVCVTLLLTFTVSGTVAFLADSTKSVTNTFTPVEVDTQIVESIAAGSKSSIQVQNNPGDNHIPVYVRVHVSGYWVNSDGAIVEPWNGSVDVNGTANTNANDEIADGKWVSAGGFYYFTVPVKPGELTTNLLAEPITGTKKENGDYLVINVVHQSIQSQPVSTVTDVWGWTPPAAQ